TSALAAPATHGSVVVDGHVATFGCSAGASVENVPVKDDRGANAGADGHVENRAVACSGSPGRFGKAGSIGVVIEANRQVIPLFNILPQGKVDPNREIGRMQHNAGVRIEWAGR